jgi:hypothetical protein
VRRVIFIVGPLNLRSQKALEKIGAVRAASRSDAGGPPRVIYEISADTFAKVNR